MKPNLYSSLVVAGILLAGMSSGFTNILLDDHFNNDDLATNPDIGGGFGTLNNANGTPGSITESGSLASIVDGTASNTNGVLSSNAFDLSNAGLTYTTTYEVAGWTSPGSGTLSRRALFTYQTNNDWIFAGDPEESRIVFEISEKDNNAFVRYQNRSGGTNTNYDSSIQDLGAVDSDIDGFTVILTVGPSGFSFKTVGLNATNQVDLTATWTDIGTDWATVLGTDGPMHVGAYIQNSSSSDGSSKIDIDRITLTAAEATTLPIVLKIFRNGANLDFEWNSQSGKLYKLVSSEDLSTAINTWSPYFDGVTTYENIAPSGTGTNTLLNVIPLGPRRFFAVIEE